MNKKGVFLKEKKEKSILSSIAHTLKENEKCPVCGSSSHPEPATGEAFTEEDHLLEAEESANTFSKECISLENEIKNLNEEEMEIIKEYKSNLNS